MKHALAVIGFSYITSLMVLNFLNPDFLIYIFASLATLFLISVFIEKFRKSKIIPAVLLTLLASTAVCFFNFTVNIKPCEKLNGTDCIISGTVCDIPYKKDAVYNYKVKVESINGEKVRPFKTQIFSSGSIECDVCDTLTGKVRFYTPEKDSGSLFNNYRANGIYVFSHFYNYEENSSEKPKSMPMYGYILKAREKMLSSLKEILPPETANIINAILIGEKHELPENIKMNFLIIGAYHLLATSGIHIAIVSQMFLWFLKKFRLTNRACALGSALLVFIFTGLAGFTPSVMRAGIMSIIYLVGIAIFRQSETLNSLGAAVLIICAVNPNSSLSIGLWLSFLSTLGIIAIYPAVKKFMLKKITKKFSKNKLVNYTISSICISLSVWAATLPAVIYFFKKVSVISLLSNLILIPPTSLLLWTSLITELLKILHLPDFIIYPPALLCGIIVSFIKYASSALAQIPYASVSTNYGFVYLWCALTLVLAAIAVQSKNFKRAMKTTFLISLILILGGALSYLAVNKNSFNAAVISCKNGVGIVISQKNKKAAIVCLNEKCNARSIENFFVWENVKNADYLNLTVNDAAQTEEAENIISLCNPKYTVVPFSKSEFLNLEKFSTKSIAFDKNIESDLWGSVKISTTEIDNIIYTQIKFENFCILVSPMGGNAEKLPDSWKTCNILIAGGLPSCYEKINFESVILSSDKLTSEINLSKLSQISKRNFSVAHQGDIYININSTEKYKIRGVK